TLNPLAHLPVQFTPAVAGTEVVHKDLAHHLVAALFHYGPVIGLGAGVCLLCCGESVGYLLWSTGLLAQIAVDGGVGSPVVHAAVHIGQLEGAKEQTLGLEKLGACMVHENPTFLGMI